MMVSTEAAIVVERSTPMSGAVELIVEHPSATLVEAGQFFQIAVGAQHALLRRPYSAAWADPSTGRIGFIFNVVGAGSAWLANRHEGHELDLVGPLGHGFDLSGSGPAVCVAGGLGVAMFPGVARALQARRRPVTMLLGARSAEQLLPAQRFPGADVRLATDDGSAGHHGSVVELLDEVDGADVFVCGPAPMLKSVIRRAEQLERRRSDIQIALETPMGCGLGTCLGCAAPHRGGGYFLTCQDGPCVRADTIDWERMSDAFHE